jgi:hypothetical protein
MNVVPTLLRQSIFVEQSPKCVITDKQSVYWVILKYFTF